MIATLIINQKPERVSNILRSSTDTTRLNGIEVGLAARVSWTRSMVMALMLLLLLAGCRR